MARYKIVWSSRAETELYQLLSYYIERNGTATFSKKLYGRIKASAQLLSRHPHLGRQTDISNIRALITDEYEIIYEILERHVLIIMIWDCRRNPEIKTGLF